MKAYELLSDPAKWTQRINARDRHGLPADVEDPNATCFCIYGALQKCYDRNDFLTHSETVRQRVKNVSQWNDHFKRTHAEVVALLKELDI